MRNLYLATSFLLTAEISLATSSVVVPSPPAHKSFSHPVSHGEFHAARSVYTATFPVLFIAALSQTPTSFGATSISISPSNGTKNSGIVSGPFLAHEKDFRVMRGSRVKYDPRSTHCETNRTVTKKQTRQIQRLSSCLTDPAQESEAKELVGILLRSALPREVSKVPKEFSKLRNTVFELVRSIQQDSGTLELSKDEQDTFIADFQIHIDNFLKSPRIQKKLTKLSRSDKCRPQTRSSKKSAFIQESLDIDSEGSDLTDEEELMKYFTRLAKQEKQREKDEVDFALAEWDAIKAADRAKELASYISFDSSEESEDEYDLCVQESELWQEVSYNSEDEEWDGVALGGQGNGEEDTYEEPSRDLRALYKRHHKKK